MLRLNTHPAALLMLITLASVRSLPAAAGCKRALNTLEEKLREEIQLIETQRARLELEDQLADNRGLEILPYLEY